MGRDRPQENAFTLIEILVTIAIIVLLAALIFPAFAKGRSSARQASCINQLRQIGLAMAMYRDDCGGLPPHLSAIYPTYVSEPEIFVCPEDPVAGQHDGNDYLEGNLYLDSGVSYTYLPNWRYAHQLGWWDPPPRYGPGKWCEATPVAMCHWHWAKGRRWERDLETPSWGTEAKGWVLVLAAQGSVHRVRAEASAAELSPSEYR